MKQQQAGDLPVKLLKIVEERKARALKELSDLVVTDGEKFLEKQLELLKRKNWSEYKFLRVNEEMMRSGLLLVLGLIGEELKNKKQRYFSRIEEYWKLFTKFHS